jgi:hypothetical protein
MRPQGKQEVAEAAVTALVVAVATAVGELLVDELRAWNKRRRKKGKEKK